MSHDEIPALLITNAQDLRPDWRAVVDSWPDRLRSVFLIGSSIEATRTLSPLGEHIPIGPDDQTILFSFRSEEAAKMAALVLRDTYGVTCYGCR